MANAKQVRVFQLQIGDLLYTSSSLYPKDGGPEKVVEIAKTSMGTEVVTTEETYVYPNEDTIVVISGNSGSCVITVEA
jgi:hypothetical protein